MNERLEQLGHELTFAATITRDIRAALITPEEGASMLADSLKTISRLAEDVARDLEAQRG